MSFTVLRPGGRTREKYAKTLATISAGQTVSKDGKTFPQASRNGEMFVNSEEKTAQGIRAYLKDRKSITICFVSNDYDEIIAQRFKRESASKLDFTGDQHFLTVFDKATPRTVYADSPEYEELIATAKTEASIYFLLVEVLPSGKMAPLFLDGVGLYRIRTGSSNSVENAMACISTLKTMTGGKCAGIPVEVFLTYPELTGPDGKKRKCPVFQFIGRENPYSYAFALPGQLLLEEAQEFKEEPLSLPFPTSALPSHTTGEVKLREPDINWSRKEIVENIFMARALIKVQDYQAIKKSLGLEKKPSNEMTDQEAYDLYEALYAELGDF
jgi:Recombination directionality factor-like